jgi:hypothetical protein
MMLCRSQGGVISDGSELIGPAEAYPDSPANAFPECGTEGKSLLFWCLKGFNSRRCESQSCYIVVTAVYKRWKVLPWSQSLSFGSAHWMTW